MRLSRWWLGAVAVLAVAGVVSQAGAAMMVINIDMSDKMASPDANSWNVISRTVPTGAVALIDDTGAASGVSVTMVNVKGSSSAADNSGAFAGTEFDPACKDYLLPTSTASPSTWTFSGLDGNYTYKFELVATTTYGNMVGDYQVGGVFGDTGHDGNDFNAYTDGRTNGTVMQWDSVSPTDGNIVVTMTYVSNTSVVLNAMRITQIPEPVVTPILAAGAVAALIRRRRRRIG